MKPKLSNGWKSVCLALALLAAIAADVQVQAATCTYSISPTGRQHGPGATTNTVSVTTGTNCTWTVGNTNPWIRILSGTNGTNSGIVTYGITDNPNPVWRTGLVMIAGQTFTLSQQPVVCSYKLSTTNRNHGYTSASGSVGLTTSPGCTWTVNNTNSWITITSPLNNTGTGVVSYVVAANSSGLGRTGSVLIADQILTLNQAGFPCTFALTPTTRQHGYGSETGLVSVTTQGGCSWTAFSTNAWITITSGASGTGNGNVGYAVAYNPDTLGRTGVVNIAGQPFTVKQRGNACTFKLSTTSRTHGSGAASNFVTVTTSSNICQWMVVNTNGWVTIISPLSQVGSNVVSYLVDANPYPAERTGAVMIADQVLTLVQHGIVCSFSISPPNRSHGYGATTGQVSVTTSSTCPWTAFTTNNWIAVLPPTNGLGSGTVTYSLSANPTIIPRTGTVAIADQTLSITQAGAPCTFSISPDTVLADSFSTTGLVAVTTLDGCPWTSANSNSWITFVGATNGVGNGSVGYSVAATASPDFRTGLVSIAGQEFTLIQFGTNCAFILSTTNRTHGYSATTGSVSVATSGQCAWSVVNTNDWISLSSSASQTGSGNVAYAVAGNPSFNPRSGVILIAGQAFVLTQRGFVCSYSLSPANRSHGYGASTGLVSVTSISNNCPWSVLNTNGWITITSDTNGTGNGSFAYNVDANGDLNSRTGLVFVADQVFTLSQAGFVCSYRLSPTSRNHGFAATNGTLTVSAASNCVWTVTETNSWITITSPANGSGNGTINYTIDGNLVPTSRTGLVMVADQVFTLIQNGATGGFSFAATSVPSTGQVKLSLAGGPGGVWDLQSSSDLVHWVHVTTLTNLTGRLDFTDTTSNLTQRFYRTVQP